VDDGRMIFAIPRGRTTYIGTTDTTYVDSKDHVVTSHEDAAYLINAVKATFPSVDLNISDIESSWAGLRPLIHEDGKSASELSRKDEIFESPTGLISIAGGKLTGYRKMAERVVNLIIRKYFQDRSLKNCFTHKLKLAGTNFSNQREVKSYIDQIYQRLKQENLSVKVAQYLVGTYGKQADSILAQYDQIKDDDKSLSLLKAELGFTVQCEMVCSLQDFFIRRTGLLYFDVPRMQHGKDQIAVELSKILRWNDQRTAAEIKALNQQISTAQSFN
jgi:glycerol-3-phosphate dehydrogenase